MKNLFESYWFGQVSPREFFIGCIFYSFGGISDGVRYRKGLF